MEELETIARELIIRDFELEFPYGQRQMKEALRQEVLKLLLHDLERLWNILYRIDVNEEKVKQLFAQSDPEKIAPGIAELIYERQLQKAKSRMEYRN